MEHFREDIERLHWNEGGWNSIMSDLKYKMKIKRM